MRRRIDNQVRVFSRGGESESIRVKQFLSGHDVPFADLDIVLEPARRDELRRLGHARTPVTLVGDTAIVGFQPDEILAALERIRD